jgi:hypothetical protein
MRKLALATVLLALALGAGCKHSTSPKLEGRWKGVHADGVPEAVQVSASSFATGSEIVVEGNQITFNTPGGRQPPATYTVDKEEAGTLVIHTDRDGSPETFTVNEKADELVWKVDGQRSITFKKVP